MLALAPALLIGGWMISSAPHDLQATRAHPCAAGETHCLVAFAGRLSGPYPHRYGGEGWVVRPVDGTHGVDFDIDAWHDGDLWAAHGQLVTAQLFDGDVAFVRVPDGADVVPMDVGPRGAMLDVASGVFAILCGAVFAARAVYARKAGESWWAVSSDSAQTSIPRGVGLTLAIPLAASAPLVILLVEGVPLQISWSAALLVPTGVVGFVVWSRGRRAHGGHRDQ